MKVAVIGIGLMGSAMARRMDGMGLDVTGYDVSIDSVNALKASGVAATRDLAEAVMDARVIVSSLPNSTIVRQAWMGEDGVLAHAVPGAVAVETSSIDPQTMIDLAAACRKAGLAALDTPVSGGPGEAGAGTLVLMIGGSEADRETAKPVLDALGQTHLPTGDVGTAKVVKLVNNVMTMGNVLVAAEAFAMGTRAGVDPDKLYNALSQSGGRSHHFTKRFPNALQQNYEPGFKVELGAKDVGLALDYARSIGQPMPASALIREIYGMAMRMGYRDKDIVAVLDMFQTMDDSPVS